MSRSIQAVISRARWLVVFITITLALFSLLGPTVSAEGGGGVVVPPLGSGEDTLGTPPLLVQPDGLGFFELLGLYIEVIF